MSAPWTPEAVALVADLKPVSASLATWAELRIDGGATVAEVRAEIRAAMVVVDAEKRPSLSRSSIPQSHRGEGHNFID